MTFNVIFGGQSVDDRAFGIPQYKATSEHGQHGRLEDVIPKFQSSNRGSGLAGQHPMGEMPEFFRNADALLVNLKDDPIFSMTIPGKLQAYLATGKPILALLNGEGARLVKDSGCGIACDAGDWQCLADSVQKLSQMNSQERDVMGRKGLLLNETEFDREKLISKLENWMLDLASGKEFC